MTNHIIPFSDLLLSKESPIKPSLQKTVPGREVHVLPGGGQLAYDEIMLSDLEVVDDSEEGKGPFRMSHKKGAFQDVSIDDRFFQSIARRSGFHKSFFSLFSPEEVIKQVLKVDGDKELIVTSTLGESPKGFGVFEKKDKLARLDEAVRAVSSYSPISSSFVKGDLRMIFAPVHQKEDMQVVGEEYAKLFMVTVPVDGFASPVISPMMMRLICTNGAVAAAKLFESSIVLGQRDAGFTLEKAVKSYHGGMKIYEDIAAALRSSHEAYASLAEFDELKKKLFGLRGEGVNEDIIQDLDRYAGEAARRQMLRDLSKKELRKSPTEIPRYALIQMATEIYSHHLDDEEDRLVLEGYVGGVLQRDPDLEGSRELSGKTPPPYERFYFKKKSA